MRQNTISNCRCLTYCCTSLFFLISLAACDARNESPGNQAVNAAQSDDVAQVLQSNANRLTDNAWLLGSYLYEAESTGQYPGDNNTVIVIASTLVNNDEHGFYSGAGLAISMTDSGAGVYSLTDLDGVTSAANTGAAVLSLNVNAGLNNTDPAVATRWSTTAATGTAEVTQNNDGQYFISINDPVVLSRDLDFGDGIPDSSDQMQFVMKNISGEAQ